MRTDKLLKIKAAILARPNQFKMGSVFGHCLDDGQQAGGCGTAACIAGWWRVLESGKTNLREVDETGQGGNIMAAEADMELPNRHLFFETSWPMEFYNKYDQAIESKDPKQMALVAGEAIDSYIASNGWEGRE